MVGESAGPQVGKLIGKMSHDDRVDLLNRLPDGVKESLLRVVDEADRRDIATLDNYDEDSVGAIMTTDYAWLPATLTAAEAVDQLRQQAPDRETIYYIYILAEAPRKVAGRAAPRRLIGVLSLRALILAARHTLVRDIMEDSGLVTLKASEDRQLAAELLARYDFIALPVVDDEGAMVGIVTHDDVIDVIQEEATEALQQQGGISPLGEGYLEASFWRVWWARVRVLSRRVRPRLGHRLRARVLRGHAQGRRRADAVHPALHRDRRELGHAGGDAGHPRTGPRRTEAGRLALGADGTSCGWAWRWARCSAALGFARAYLVDRSYLVAGSGDADARATRLRAGAGGDRGLPVGTLVGAMLPLVFRRVGADPALASSPAVTTLVDVVGIVTYFTIASIWLL